MEAKHAKKEEVNLDAYAPEETEQEEIKFVADVPGDDFYKAQINTLQKKLDSAQIENEMKDEYINDLEKQNMALIERVNHLREAMANMIEEKYSHV